MYITFLLHLLCLAVLHLFLSTLETHNSFYLHSFLKKTQVFSDEFEQDGRSFEDGGDPRWTAIDKNDCKLCIIH